MMKKWRRVLSFLLAVCCVLAGAGGAKKPAYSFKIEKNADGYKPENYPYVVHSESADWYISKTDLEQMGEQALYEGLEEVLALQEEDFREAREALAGALKDEIPKVTICTDFGGKAEISQISAAYYNPRSNFIKLFHSWDKVKASLTHEYVHYLTFSCAKVGCTPGFWAEGIADKITRIDLKSRLSRSVNMGASAEEVEFFKEKGAWDDEADCIDEKVLYFGCAELFHTGLMLDQPYFAVCSETLTRTEKIQEKPKPEELSYYEAASMVAYLMETYGEDWVYSHWDTDPAKIEEICGKTFLELYREWAAWNSGKCAELGIVIE